MGVLLDNRSDIEVVIDGSDEEYKQLLKVRKQSVILNFTFAIILFSYAISCGFFDYDPLQIKEQDHFLWSLLLTIGASLYFSARSTMDHIRGIKKYRKQTN